MGQKSKIKKPKRVSGEAVTTSGTITGQFDHDLAALSALLSANSDCHVTVIRTLDDRRVGVFFYEDLVDLELLSKLIVSPLQRHAGALSAQILTERLSGVPVGMTEREPERIAVSLAEGAVAVLMAEVPEAVLFIIPCYAVRGIERSKSEDVIIGPHTNFSEDLGNNLALVRRLLRSPKLRIESREMGYDSVREVAVIYLSGVAPMSLVSEVERRLSKAQLPLVPGAGFLVEFLEDEPLSTLPQLMLTERPDRVVASLCEGRVVILADGDPTSVIAPFFLPQALQAAEDYYEKPTVASFLRWLRLLSIVLSIFLPGLWIALASFHHGIIPPDLFNAILSGRENVPLPTVLEAFALLIAFDIVIEASTRLPTAVGQAIGIVGAIILGQSAVQASLVSPTMTIVVALSGLAIFTQPAANLVGPGRVLKYFVLAVSSILGLFGTIWATIFFIIRAASMSSFGYPYLYPMAPFDGKGVLDVLIKLPNTALPQRLGILTRSNAENGTASHAQRKGGER